MSGIQAADFLPIVGAIFTLVVLEGLLSADNALVLAVMVRHLPERQQRRALRYGIWGAFIFRFIAVLFASLLLQYWQLKVVGGFYLLYLAVSHFVLGDDEGGEGGTSRFGTGFWGTVIGVELADIAFSIDSILAAVGVGGQLPERLAGVKVAYLSLRLWVIYIGGVLGIVTMRFVAGYFLLLIKRFQGLAAGAYVLVGWVGLELIGSGFHRALHPDGPANAAPPGGWREQIPHWVMQVPLQMPGWLYWGGMGVIILASMFYKPRNLDRPFADQQGLVEVGKAMGRPDPES